MPSLNIILAALGIVFFCAASACALLDLFRQHPPEKGEFTVSLLLALGCATLTAMLVLQGLTTGCSIPIFTRFDALAVYVLFLTVAALFLLTSHRTHGVMAILAPYVTILLLVGLPAVDAKAGTSMQLSMTPPVILHMVIAFTGYALFSLASILACAYLVQDHNLKHRNFGVVFERLPALETLDHLMFHLVSAAFLLITISLMLGAYLVYQSGRMAEWIKDPKVLATMITWSLCAILVHMRTNAKRHGTRVAMFTVAGLILILFSMVGIHLVAQSIHNFVDTGIIPK